jgi:lambda family phage portal protein
MVGKTIDRLIGLFSPKAELSRTLARRMINGERMYAAAKSGRKTGAWSPVESSVNDEIRVSSQKVRERVRQLVRDFPYFAHAVDQLVSLTVGQGINFQSKADPALRSRIEDAWKRWSEQADITGRMSFPDLCQLAVRQECENGEFFLVKRQSKDPKRFLPFALQAIESDRLTDLATSPTNKQHEIDQGVEYDPDTGVTVAYWFESDTKPLRIPAEQVIHGFKMVRPGQLRGISPFAPGVLVAHDMAEYLDAELEGAKMAARYLAFIEAPDIAAYQTAHGIGVNPDSGQREDELQNAILEYLRPGEKVNLASHNRPGDNFEPFVKLVLRMLSVTTGVPYELLSGDYTGVNYSTMRVCRNDLSQALKVPQGRMINQLCNPVFHEVMDQAMLTGKLQIPGYWTDPRKFQACKWIVPGMEPIDPLKESKAHVDQLDSLLRSPQEIAAARGRDYEEILDEIQQAEEMSKKRGLSRGQVNTALASNPATIEDE